MSKYNDVSYSLRQRSDTKNYFADFHIRGHRFRKTLKTADKNVAHTKAKLEINQYLERLLPSRSVSVKEFDNKYFTHISARLRENTVTSHRLAMNHLFKFRDFKNLTDITSRDIDEFMTYLLNEIPAKKKKAMEPVSVNTNIRMLRQIFNQAVRWGYAIENPFNNVRLLKYQQKEVRVLDSGEIRKILHYADERFPKYADLFRFYLLTGMRFSEPLNMSWENVHWKEQYIELTLTKGKYNRRIPLLTATKDILKSRMEENAKPFPLEPRRVRRVFAEICKDKDIKNASIQNLRSSAFSYMVNIGVPQPLIRKIIGHTGDTIGQIHNFNLPTKSVIKSTSKLQGIIGKR